MPALMVQGASSSAGKSLVTTALARALARRGIDVVPFKAQNMSNNARVVAGGGEIGTAQYLQALAAGVEPDVRMNPVLVKPEGDEASQVVVLGTPDHELGRLAWQERPDALWPAIVGALDELLAAHELVLIEGAGSPAEINLRGSDLANMRTARAAGARVVVVGDIDRGGVFAHLYGTWALLPPDERALLVGFILNKFRGDRGLLAPAPELLERLTGVPTLGVLPWLDHGLPDEDGAATPARRADLPTVAVVRYPTASNLDEFKQLEQVAAVEWATTPAQVDDADLVVLPGSKNVAADLAWLERRGLDAAVCRRARAGRRVLGICGGMQMLGDEVDDETGASGRQRGLALLPLRTAFAETKRTGVASTRFASLGEPWTALADAPLEGYQIRHGSSTATRPVDEALPDGLGYVAGATLGVYLHGLFEQPAIVRALVGDAPSRSLDHAFDSLADTVEAELDLSALLTTVGIP